MKTSFGAARRDVPHLLSFNTYVHAWNSHDGGGGGRARVVPASRVAACLGQHVLPHVLEISRKGSWDEKVKDSSAFLV